MKPKTGLTDREMARKLGVTKFQFDAWHTRKTHPVPYWIKQKLDQWEKREGLWYPKVITTVEQLSIFGGELHD